MAAAAPEFGLDETHGILKKDTISNRSSSEGRGWQSIYASTQDEQPYEDAFSSVRDHLLVLHLDRPVAIERSLSHSSGRCIIPPGGIHIIPGGMDFRVRLCGQLATMHLYLRAGMFEEVAADLASGDPGQVELLPRFGDRDPLAETLLLGVREALLDDLPPADLYVDYLGRALAARLIRGHSTASPRSPAGARPRLPRRQFQDAVDFMRQNLHRQIELRSIAQIARLSPGHFTRQFRATTGLAPHQYLIRLRLEQARTLLENGTESIAGIAFACGFASQEHMTRFFTRLHGMGPAAFRKRRRS